MMLLIEKNNDDTIWPILLLYHAILVRVHLVTFFTYWQGALIIPVTSTYIGHTLKSFPGADALRDV